MTLVENETASSCAALLSRECPELGLACTGLSPFHWQPSYSRSTGTHATMAYLLDPREHQRRQQTGQAGVTRLDWLDLLMELPAGMHVPRTSLTSASWRAVHRMPPGCVDLTPGGVTRRIVKPLEPKLAIVTGRQFKAGLIRTGRFAPYCTRVLALEGTPRDLTQAAIEADLYGIGLIINTARDPRLVVAPARYEQYRFTPAGWAFTEHIYKQMNPPHSS